MVGTEDEEERGQGFLNNVRSAVVIDSLGQPSQIIFFFIIKHSSYEPHKEFVVLEGKRK